MIYKIEQWDNDNQVWFQVGESLSSACALNICKELKEENKKMFFRIVVVINML